MRALPAGADPLAGRLLCRQLRLARRHRRARRQRPTRTNFWVNDDGVAAGRTRASDEPNTFGTNEFIRFCQLAGGAAVPGREPPQPAAARLLPLGRVLQLARGQHHARRAARAATASATRSASATGASATSRGAAAATSRPEEYAVEFRRFTAWVPRYGVDLAFVGSGPNAATSAGPAASSAKLTEKGDGALGGMWGWALHHYSWNVSRGATTDWNEGKGDAVQFTIDEWYELLNEADRMDGLITGHWTVMGETDRRHRVKLVVDEWGAWYKPGTEVDPRTFSASSRRCATRWSRR